MQRSGIVAGEHFRRQHLHELARHAVVVGHRDQREGELVDARVGALQAAVPREQAGERVVLRSDDLRDDLAEHRRRLEELAQVQAVDVRRVGLPVERQRDERLQHAADGLGEGQRRIGEGAELACDRGDRLGQDRPVEAFLVAEVIVDRRYVGARRQADLARRGGGVALGGEDARAVGDQLLAGVDAAIGRPYERGFARRGAPGPGVHGSGKHST